MKNTSAALTRIQAIEPVSYVPFRCGAEASSAHTSPHHETPMNRDMRSGITRTIELDPFKKFSHRRRTVAPCDRTPPGFRSRTMRGQNVTCSPQHGRENNERTCGRRAALAGNTRIAQLQKEGWDYRKSVSGTLVLKGPGLHALLNVSSKIRANFAAGIKTPEMAVGPRSYGKRCSHCGQWTALDMGSC